MAAKFIKPTMHRQAFFSAPAKRAFTAQATIPRSFANPTSSPSLFLRRASALPQSKSLGALPSQARVAAFHASSRKALLPLGPQVIEGTTNDPAPIKEPEPLHGSYHWTFERLVAVGLVPLTIAPFAAGTLNPTLDSVLVALTIIHSHVGFQSIIIDYIPTKHYPVLRKVFWWGLRLATLTVAIGFYEFETHDVGVTEAVKRIWRA